MLQNVECAVLLPDTRPGRGDSRRITARSGANAPPRERIKLLAALPDAELARRLPHLEVVDLPLGKVHYESGIRLSQVFFPTTAIVSLLSVMADGSSTEIAVVTASGGLSRVMSQIAAAVEERQPGLIFVDSFTLVIIAADQDRCGEFQRVTLRARARESRVQPPGWR